MSAISISMVAVEDVVPSKDNRRVFSGPDEKNPKLVELAQSIREVGVLEPLLGRPHPEQAGKVELRAGERRLRASRLVGLMEVPVIVRDMTDEEAFLVTVVENVQREDQHPIEQAQSIEMMYEHGWTSEQIADKVGKSASWCARRRQLMRLSAEWIFEALQGLAVAWSAEHLDIIARFPERVQDEMHDVATRKGERDEWANCTVAQLRAETAAYLHAIQLAPWKLDDETLCPKLGACSTCMKRSDTEPLLFDESEWQEPGGKKAKAGARCLDAACWKQKDVAHLMRRLTEVKEKTGTAPVLVADYQQTRELPAGLQKSVQQKYHFERCKKTDPKAKPLVTASGDMYWGKPYGWGGSSSTGKGNGEQKAKKTLEEKRAALQKKRDLWVLAELNERLPDGKQWEGKIMFHGGTCRALAAVFGGEQVTGKFTFEGKDVWVFLEELCSADEAVVDRRLAEAALQVLGNRLMSEMSNARYRDTVSMEDARRVCELMEWDFEVACARAAEEYPEPKGWGKEEGKKKDKSTAEGGYATRAGGNGKGKKDSKDGKESKDGEKKEKSRKPAKVKGGMCKECGCTAGNACMNEHGEPCGWADGTQTLCTHCAAGRVGLKGTPWEGDVRVSEDGVFVEREEIPVPMPKGAHAKVMILVVEASTGDWRFGSEVLLGEEGKDLTDDVPVTIRSETYATRDGAIQQCAGTLARWLPGTAYSKWKMVVKALEAWAVERKMETAGV